MTYKVVSIPESELQPLTTTNASLLSHALNDHDVAGYNLHSVVTVQHGDKTSEFLLIFAK